MTLKVRLTVMMVVILGAVLVLQYLLLERDRRETMSRLAELGSGLDRTTALFVDELHDLSLRPREEDLSQILHRISGDDAFSRDAQVTVFVWADSTSPGSEGGDGRIESMRLEWIQSIDESVLVGPPDGLPLPPRPFRTSGRDSIVVEAYSGEEHRVIVRSTFETDSFQCANVESLLVELDRDRESGGSSRPMDAGSAAGGKRSKMLVHAGASFAGRVDGSNGNDVVVNLPLLAADSDSFLAVQVRYPLDAIQAELENQRKRGLLWLGTVLGVGVLGAFLVAGQFTRPIRALQASFRKVEEGDLSVRVEPRRGDEIGRLTGSFNEMVDRLRESREVESRLGEAERLASVGRLAAGVAHEIRNPLNAIQLTALQMRDVALRGADDSSATEAQLERYYQLVSNEVKRLERLVSAFLDLAREETLSRIEIDGAASLEASIDLFRREAAQRSVSIAFASPGEVRLLADPTRLPAVWNNLLSNALAASPERGTIRVEARVEGRVEQHADRGADQRADHGVEQRGEAGAEQHVERGVESRPSASEHAGAPTFVVVVRDEGPGISREDRARIWEPFYSGREAGTGLGLSIVRAVIERHGGTVNVLDSDPGAAFEVRLPVEGESDRSPSAGGARA